jgi:hypothetical protein
MAVYQSRKPAVATATWQKPVQFASPTIARKARRRLARSGPGRAAGEPPNGLVVHLAGEPGAGAPCVPTRMQMAVLRNEQRIRAEVPDRWLQPSHLPTFRPCVNGFRVDDHPPRMPYFWFDNVSSAVFRQRCYLI